MNVVTRRLDGLERRMGNLERKVDDLNDTCIEIRSQMKTLMWLFGIGVGVGVALLSVGAHLSVQLLMRNV